MHSKAFTARGDEVVAQAIHRYCRVSARKIRQVAALIRNKTVGEALNILLVTAKPSAQPHILRLLQSAVANVPDGDVANPKKDLRVSEIAVDGAFMLKRFRPAPMGRAVRVRKRSSHITLRLTRVGGAVSAPAAAPASTTTESEG